VEEGNGVQKKSPQLRGLRLSGVGFVNFVCFRNGTPFGFQRIQDNVGIRIINGLSMDKERS
jgi:hypothetical protein